MSLLLSLPLLERPGEQKRGPDTKRPRLSDSDNSDDEEEEEGAGLEMEGVAVISGDSADQARAGADAELKAAQARASKPLEERQQIFKDMLLERGVSSLAVYRMAQSLRHNILCFFVVLDHEKLKASGYGNAMAINFCMDIFVYNRIFYFCTIRYDLYAFGYLLLKVSAFSTWEKELPKFVFDPRYSLLTQKERKACFQAFIRSRTEEERREKRNQLKEMKEQFRSLLEEARLNPKSVTGSCVGVVTQLTHCLF